MTVARPDAKRRRQSWKRGQMTDVAIDRLAPAPTRTRERPSAVWETAVFLIVFVAVLGPILFLVLGSFSAARLPSEFTLSMLTLRNYIKVWSDPSTYEILSDTLLFAGGSTLFGLVFAASLASRSPRTHTPGRIWSL